MVHAITIGTSANLMFGYHPVWNPNGDVASPFFLPAQQPLRPQNPATTPSDFQLWVSTPVITLHPSAQSLLSTIYDYDVLPVSNDPQTIDIPSGPLALNDADAASALRAAEDFLGLDLSETGNYMLVTYERCASTTTGDYSDGNASRARGDILTPEALAVIDALPPAEPPVSGSPLYDSKLTLDDARKYLAAMSELGTHFVSRTRTGDKLVQVFVYDDDMFEILRTQFNHAATAQPDGTKAVSGLLANSWEVYTSPTSSGGYVTAYGALTTIARDPTLVAAIQNGDWANGYVPDGTPSIFAPVRNYGLLAALKMEVTYACQLTPLAELLPNALVEGPWDRIVAGGLMQKYGNAVVIPLRRPLDYDWSSIFPQTTDSWASGIVTPVIDIYQERIDLAKVKMMGADIIGEAYPMVSFTSFSQVLQATSATGADPIAIPTNQITMVSQIIDTTQAAQTPVLSMSDKGLRTMTLSCENMYGALIFQSGTDPSPVSRRTALDGILMETPSTVDRGTKRYTVDLVGVLTTPPSEEILITHSQSVEFSVVAGEALLQSQGPGADTVKQLELSYLQWLANIIPSNTTNEVLSNARVRALYLVNSIADFGMDTVFVPYVTYDTYSKYVGDLVNQASFLNGQIATYQSQLMTTTAKFQTMNSIAAVNKNVQSIGNVLTQYFKALADGRGSIDKYYDGIIAQLTSQLNKTLENIVHLQGQLTQQQKLISNLGSPPGIVQKFEKDYVEYEKDEVFKATMSIVTGLFSLGMAFAGIPGAAEKGVLDALKALKDVFDKLQSVMKVLSQLSVIEKVTNDIGKLNSLANSIQAASEAGTMQMPSLVDLQMVPNNVEAALTNVPTNGKLQQDKADLIAATKNLVIVGTGLLTAQTEASQLLVEISNKQRLKTINSQQQSSMSALGNALNLTDPVVGPNLAKVDLIGMTGQLQFQLKQVLSTLARVLENQNGALQFTYFGEPASITSFSLGALLGVISAQDASIINAIQRLNPPPRPVPDPITITIPSIPHKELTGGRFKRFSVSASTPAFINYVMVRIDKILPRIKGVKSTDSDQFEIELSTQAHPFMDRDPERQTRTFASTQRFFGPFVYDVKTGALKFGGEKGVFADNVTHITPFTDWSISFPAKSTNAGITFDDLLVDIELEFHITAIYNDPMASLKATMQRALAANRVEPMTAMLKAKPPMGLAQTLVAMDTRSEPSLSYLEGQMYQNQAVLQGWDAAFSMLSNPVNAFLNQQFQAYLKTLRPGDDSGLMKIEESYFGTPAPIGRGFWSATITKFNFEVTNPLLQFIAGSDQAEIQQYIKGGNVVVGTVDVTGDNKTSSSTFLPGEAYLPDGPLTFTADTATGELVIAQGNVLGLGMGGIFLSTTGTLPAPLKPGDPSAYTNEYYVASWSSTGTETRIKLTADTAGKDAISVTDAGSGTQTLTLEVNWASPSVVDTSKSPYIHANVQLSTIRGVVAPPDDQGNAEDTLTVTLDFPSGSFVLKDITVEPKNWDPSGDASRISNAIANYYSQNEIRFDVQTINTTDLAADKALTPTQFVLHGLTTQAGNNVLQLLIATSGKPQSSQSLTLTEPVAYNPAGPVAGISDFMVSLMISSQLTFQHVFVNSFNRGSTNFMVDAVAPGTNYQAWSARMKTGMVTAPVPFKDSYQVNGTKTEFRISASSNDLSWDISGLTYTRTATEGVALYYSNGEATGADGPTGGTNVDFQYRQYLYSPGMSMPGGGYIPGRYYWTEWQDASAMAYVTMNGTYPLEVFDQGGDQLIKFSTTNPEVKVDKSSELKPTGACECNNNDVKIALMSALSDSIPEQLQANMQQISFKPLSVMALQSLLFPAGQLIAMSTAKVPGDSLVVGRFLAQVRKKSPNGKYTITIPAAANAKGSFGGQDFQNGTTVNSVTKSNMPASFQVTYGPVDSSLGGQVTYDVNIETGKISPFVIATVYQSDADKAPQNVALLLPGYPSTKGK
ncbi:hypothetical protein [Rhodospirillum sp. A1_3_36]|uniref:hypothetical protein n=1 Tax=Rhodospirillum sp. A1_3_36 TaxID=3391666 RepID=UPI0039A5DFD8